MSSPRRSNGKSNYFNKNTSSPKYAKESKVNMKSISNMRAFFIFAMCFVLVVGLFAAIYIKNINKLNDLKEERGELQTEKQNLVLTNQELKEVYNFVNTKEYIIYMARKLLGWVLPEDSKYTIIPEESQ